MHARRDARLHLTDNLLEECAGLLLIVTLGRSKLTLEPIPHNACNNRTNLRCSQDFLGLSFELWFWETNCHNRCHPSKNIVLFWASIFCANLELPRVLINLASQNLQNGLFKARDMRSALRGSDDINEGFQLRIVANPPAKGTINFADTLGFNSTKMPAFRIQRLNSLSECSFTLNMPGVSNSAVVREPINEVNHATIKAE